MVLPMPWIYACPFFLCMYETERRSRDLNKKIIYSKSDVGSLSKIVKPKWPLFIILFCFILFNILYFIIIIIIYFFIYLCIYFLLFLLPLKEK